MGDLDFEGKCPNQWLDLIHVKVDVRGKSIMLKVGSRKGSVLVSQNAH